MRARDLLYPIFARRKIAVKSGSPQQFLLRCKPTERSIVVVYILREDEARVRFSAFRVTYSFESQRPDTYGTITQWMLLSFVQHAVITIANPHLGQSNQIGPTQIAPAHRFS